MMEMSQEIISAIGSLGFPIVACCYLAYLHHQTEQQRLDDEKRHSDERKGMTEALKKMNATLEYILSFVKDAAKDDAE